MKKEISSEFHQFIVNRFGYYEAKHLHQRMDLPSHPVTRAYNNPENAPHKILIAFCELLDMNAHELIRDYKVGTSRISDVEKTYHQRIYEELTKRENLS